MEGLSRSKNELALLWEERKGEFDQCQELMKFFCDAEEMENWVLKQEVSKNIILKHIYIYACKKINALHAY